MMSKLFKPRNKQVGIRLNDEELDKLIEEARNEKLKLTEYLRRKINK